MNNIAAFIANYATELILGFFILAVLTALVLLIALIRRKPQDVIAGLQDNFIDLANKQQRLEGAIKDEITSNRQETAQSLSRYSRHVPERLGRSWTYVRSVQWYATEYDSHADDDAHRIPAKRSDDCICPRSLWHSAGRRAGDGQGAGCCLRSGAGRANRLSELHERSARAFWAFESGGTPASEK